MAQHTLWESMPDDYGHPTPSAARGWLVHSAPPALAEHTPRLCTRLHPHSIPGSAPKPRRHPRTHISHHIGGSTPAAGTHTCRERCVCSLSISSQRRRRDRRRPHLDGCVEVRPTNLQACGPCGLVPSTRRSRRCQLFTARAKSQASLACLSHILAAPVMLLICLILFSEGTQWLTHHHVAELPVLGATEP
jgi:hypothetical protein